MSHRRKRHPALIALGIVTAIIWLIARATRRAWQRHRAKCPHCRGKGIIWYSGRAISGYRPCLPCHRTGIRRKGVIL